MIIEMKMKEMVGRKMGGGKGRGRLTDRKIELSIRTDWNGILVLEIYRSNHNLEGRGGLGGM